MKILFVCLSVVRFDVETPAREPLGGTESCVAHLAVELARSHEVALLAPTEARIVRAVRHIDAASRPDRAFFDCERFDIIVVASAAALVPALRRLSPRSRIVFWSHEAPGQSSLDALRDPACQRALDAIVFVSRWQRDQTAARLPLAARARIIGNGLTPAFENMFRDVDELLAVKEMRGAYTSTPYRGLSVLLDAHGRLDQALELDVFSSMRVYRQDDAPFEALYRRARGTNAVTYHGSVPQSRLAEAMRRVSFLTYPCIYPETFCIAALEAMAAGATVVATELGALEATTMGYARLLRLAGLSTQTLPAGYAAFLDAAVRDAATARRRWGELMFEQLVRVNRECTWRRRSTEWIGLFEELAHGGDD